MYLDNSFWAAVFLEWGLINRSWRHVKVHNHVYWLLLYFQVQLFVFLPFDIGLKVIPLKKIRSIDFLKILSIHWLSWGNTKDVIKKGGARLCLRAIANQTYHIKCHIAGVWSLFQNIWYICLFQRNKPCFHLKFLLTKQWSK